MSMRTLARIFEIGLTVSAIVYSAMLTHKWVAAEKQVSYLEGRWSVYEAMAEDPKGLKKW